MSFDATGGRATRMPATGNLSAWGMPSNHRAYPVVQLASKRATSVGTSEPSAPTHASSSRDAEVMAPNDAEKRSAGRGRLRQLREECARLLDSLRDDDP